MNRDRTSLDRPAVSIVVASKNAASTLQRCIDSITRQTYPCWEMIVIDGDSTDETVEIIKANSKNIAYWESRPDRGIAHAWNKALKQLTGDWALFLGADDVLEDRFVLENVASLLKQASRHGKRVVYGKIVLTGADGRAMSVMGQPWDIIKKDFFMEKDLIPHPACFHHTSVFHDYGPFDEDFHIAMDYEFLIRVLKTEEPLFMDMIVSKMSFGGLSHHPSTLLKMHRESHAALLKHGLRSRTVRFRINQVAYHILSAVMATAGEKAARWYLDVLRIISGKPRTWTIND